MPTRRIKRRNAALKKISELDQKDGNCVVIHYSCESFYNISDGKTPRVTSIAVRNLASGQTDSFSIHKIAEQKKIDFSNIESNYDNLEKEMLDEFYNHVGKIRHCTWIHWNMRDINYGFPAIEHRYKVLGGTPIDIPEERKFDLARALIDVFGVKYISHPRLENLINLNKMTARDFLVGKDEAAAFDNKEFVKLHQSTLRKADIMANIFERIADGSIKTNAKWADIYGFSLESFFTYIKQHWLLSAISIIATIAGAIAKIAGIF
jgi:hypothetical protein